jgi:DNA helicase II / ATP-dependent DNA helicase PcrA
MDFLTELNEAQRAAVTSVEGPNMIIAGAGSGKTRVITYRLAFLMQQGLADPFELLALTFTNKAAKEMRERIEKIVGKEAKSIWMGTFHSIFSRILRVHAEKLNYTKDFTIYDSDDSQSLIRSIIKELKFDDKTHKPKAVQSVISMAKNNLINAEEYEQKYVMDARTEVIAKVFKAYTNRCFKANAMDFDDLLVKPLELFVAYPEVLHRYQHQFRYIMVDEFQDTNYAQYLITRKLGAVHENICVVGDDAQSIYAFRGATIQNILNFKRDYPDVKTHKLEQNYRSTSVIVNTANSIIANNLNQLEKTVFTDNEEGEKVKLIAAENELDEARRVVDIIREQKQVQNYFNKDFAILYRTNSQSRSMEDALRKAGIAYRIYGGLSFYRRKEIKDMVAYLRMALNPRDEEALKRIINFPARGVGPTTMNHLLATAAEWKVSLWEVLERTPQAGFSVMAENALLRFVNMIKGFQGSAQTETAFEAASYIAKNSGLLAEFHSDDSLEGKSRWQNVQELLNAIQEFTQNPEDKTPTLDSFLAEIALFTDQDEKDKGEDRDTVSLMTLHSAKGLEFSSVFLVGVEEGLFPGALSITSREDLEEERRLFYVGITRAMKKLQISYARTRNRYGSFTHNEPSRFIREIKPTFLQPMSAEVQRTVLQKIGAAPIPQRRPGVKDPVLPPDPDFVGDDLTGLTVGMRVEHNKFGKGLVLQLEGKEDDKKATIQFDSKGEKILLLRYARLRILTEN